jgi:hypothetical protein
VVAEAESGRVVSSLYGIGDQEMTVVRLKICFYLGRVYSMERRRRVVASESGSDGACRQSVIKPEKSSLGTACWLMNSLLTPINLLSENLISAIVYSAHCLRPLARQGDRKSGNRLAALC